ncbi:MAG: pilin [Candidatus Magasanikbacteria bacterium]|nr:pilin [Candidatus Magasanikbacteria bacterium]
MKKFLTVFCFFVIVGFLGFFLTQALAQDNDVVKLPNPLGSENPSPTVILNLAGRVAYGFIAVMGSIALVMFVYGGFLWLTSRGEPDKIKKGKDVFVWSTVGIVVILSSYLLVSFVISGITGTTGGKCCVTEINGKFSCNDIKAGDTAGAKSCAASNGTTVGGVCEEIAACPGSCPAGGPCK